MIKLKNIKIDSNIVKCNIIPEDSHESGKLEIDLSKNIIVSSVLPVGYEWCKKHLEYAKEYLIELYKSAREIPTEKLIMWN